MPQALPSDPQALAAVLRRFTLTQNGDVIFDSGKRGPMRLSLSVTSPPQVYVGGPIYRVADIAWALNFGRLPRPRAHSLHPDMRRWLPEDLVEGGNTARSDHLYLREKSPAMAESQALARREAARAYRGELGGPGGATPAPVPDLEPLAHALAAAALAHLTASPGRAPQALQALVSAMRSADPNAEVWLSAARQIGAAARRMHHEDRDPQAPDLW